ncbi:MAG: IMP dehydrogenase [Bacteroidales bacterium]|nr:IMP dehydrogenase [Candidatus Scybalousia scybalohippi]
MTKSTFVAFGLEEFKTFIDSLSTHDFENDEIHYICIDIANGHMKSLIDLCQNAKERFGYHVCIMTGNIANPETYVEYAKAGIDFCRCNIGSGAMCITACNSAVYYPTASLIKEVADQRWNIEQCILASRKMGFDSCPYKSVPYIIADGGFDNYDKIIKALALGADYVMIGNLFAQCYEACAPIDIITCVNPEIYLQNNPISGKNLKWIYNNQRECFEARSRVYYGMSTKRAQLETGNTILKTSEGIERVIPVTYTLAGWTENFIHYLRSAMSYTDSRTLQEFKNAQYCIISQASYNAFFK